MENELKIVSLSSGSSGNCTYISDGKNEILIDAGISAKRICDGLKCLGTDIKNISALFITHEHCDHVGGLAVLSKKADFDIHITELSAMEYCLKNKPVRPFSVHPGAFSVKIGEMTVDSFITPHDSRCCVGYTVRSNGNRFGLATDIGYVSKEAVDALVGCEKILLEANYDEKMLENGVYSRELKDRVSSHNGHLSNIDCAAFSKYLAERGTKKIMLVHLSEENNTPELAFGYVSAACRSLDVKISVANRHTMSEI